jgi:cell division protein FtsI (penicillin-binding protein 3)
MTAMTAIPAAQRVRAPTPQQQALALTYHRLMLMMLVFAGVTFLIVMRLLMLQIFTDRSVAAIGNPLLPARGTSSTATARRSPGRSMPGRSTSTRTS